MMDHKPKKYKTIDKSSLPDCCIVCRYIGMENYWEFICDYPNNQLTNPWSPLPVDFNGLCRNFERDEG